MSVPIASPAPSAPAEAQIAPVRHREPLLVRLFRRLDDNLAEF